MVSHIVFYRFLFIVFPLVVLGNIQAISQGVPARGDAKWQLSAGGLLNRSIVADKKFSSLPFAAIMPGIGASVRYNGAVATHEINFLYTKGTVKTNAVPGSTAEQLVVAIDYINLYQVHTSANKLFTYRIGGSFQFLHAARSFHEFININKSFEILTSLGVVNEVSYKLPGITLSDRVVIPVVFVFSQSPYGANEFSSESLKGSSDMGSFFRHSEFTAIPKLFRIKNCITARKNINQRQSVSLSYTFDFYAIKASREVQQASHQLMLSYSYTL